MPNLSIKDVPEPLAEALRQRAARNHRSLQGELMALLESAVAMPAAMPAAPVATPLHVAEPAVTAYAAVKDGDLLARLDAIVAGSQWGKGPFLTREQANDRRLGRELEYLAKRGTS